MKISLKWLSDHVEVEDFFSQPQVLAEKLTDVGLEVEEVLSQGKGLENVVVGQITKLGKHPDADKLTYCDVNVGQETLKIVCGAKNHKEGDKVCVAQVGAVLPGDFKIKKSKIRGVESFGMLCSLSELGLETDKKSEGILILPQDVKVGEDFSKAYGLDDVIFEVNVTPNRADCLSHLGLAREISLIFDRPLKTREAQKGEASTGDQNFKIELKNPELCPRYMGQMVYGVQVKESPEWLKKRLESVGLKSINNIVDVTNYIMFDSGQPLHAFDAASLNGEKIIISKAQAGEKFVTLDGTEIKLSGEELTIRDAQGPVALAGVVGGENSGVSDSTQNIFLEAAHFIPSTVRKTSRALGIDTDSSYRFSRGTDVSRVHEALNEALDLLVRLTGGKPAPQAEEAYPLQKEKSTIEISHAYIDQRLGFKTNPNKVEDLFKRLGFAVEKEGESWKVQASDYRWDIEIKEDIVEEVGRILGYDQIPEILPSFSFAPQREKSLYPFFKKIKAHLQGLGYNEAVHYNFYSSREEVEWSEQVSRAFYASKDFVDIENPLGADLARMRTALSPQFVSNYIRNWRLGDQQGKIYEVGSSHFKNQEGFEESSTLCVAYWSETTAQKVMDEILATLESFLKDWGVKAWTFKTGGEVPDLFHPKLTAQLNVEGKNLGFVYALNPQVAKAHKVSASYCGLEINLDQFLKTQPRPKKFKDFSRQPIVERDFSALVDKDFNYLEVQKKVKKAAGDLFKTLSVVDTFEGEKVPEGKLSVTFRGQFQSRDHTLSEKELKSLQEKILKDLAHL